MKRSSRDLSRGRMGRGSGGPGGGGGNGRLASAAAVQSPAHTHTHTHTHTHQHIHISTYTHTHAHTHTQQTFHYFCYTLKCAVIINFTAAKVLFTILFKQLSVEFTCYDILTFEHDSHFTSIIYHFIVSECVNSAFGCNMK